MIDETRLRLRYLLPKWNFVEIYAVNSYIYCVEFNRTLLKSIYFISFEFITAETKVWTLFPDLRKSVKQDIFFFDTKPDYTWL